MADSLQHSLDRVRRPRVQVTYDVETGNAIQRKELPFVVGVMADLSGQPSQPAAPMKTRKFVPLDRDNFQDVLAKSNARIATRVDNKLADDNTQLPVVLNFRSMEDFEPEQVAKQVPVLRELLEMRTQLSNLLGKLEGNDKLEQLLSEVIQSSETAKSLATDLGVEGDTK
ncbi:MAG TPA: type VI secretion system contractile sheath small subunit [Planctomycetaceae bacterium]|nr:type VI secretion system contractile sheath small subunit [Planctomycetaceae bacterium]